MGYKCCIVGCDANYDTSIENNGTTYTVFEFPPINKYPELRQQWVRFVNSVNWDATDSSRICEKHFDEKFILHGKRCRLVSWKLNPLPSIYTGEALERPSSLPTPVLPRKPPKVSVYQEDQLSDYSEKFIINSFQDLLEKSCLEGYHVMKMDTAVVYYNVEFRETNMMPQILESIKIDKNLKVELQYKGNPIPLPSWFVRCRDAKVNNLGQIENFPAHIREVANCGEFSILEELEKRKHYKPKGRPPFSSSMIRYALMLRHTSAQAYRLMLEKFPLPSFSTLAKIQQGGVDAIKAVKLLLEQGKISKDIILMTDEMYLDKGTQFHGGEYVGADIDGTLYKGIVTFMIVGLRKSIP